MLRGNGDGESDSDASDDDAKADAIIQQMQHKLRRKKLEAEECAAAEAQDAAALAAVVQPGWGFAARTAALRRIQKGRGDVASRLRAVVEQASLQAPDALVQTVLTNPDVLYEFFTLRMPSPHEPVTDESLHAFASCAAVCMAWRDAVVPLARSLQHLRHGRQLRPPPPPSPHIDSPSFCELAPTGELVVAESHQIAVLSPPSAAPRARWTRVDLTRGGAAKGEVYYPHGVRCSSDGKLLYVADRSNQRVQCLRMRDGACMHLTRDEHYSPRLLPYGLVLWRKELFVADAATDQILVLDALDLGSPPTRTLGGGAGEGPGSLGAVRGLALWHLDADAHRPARAAVANDAAPAAGAHASAGRTRLLVVESSNNRVSVFGIDEDEGPVCTFGGAPSQGGALPLRRPYDVLHAHGMFIVSEYEGKRLCCFAADESCAPLQILAPTLCGALTGLACDGGLIYALDAQRGRIHYFGPTADTGKEAATTVARGGGGGAATTARTPLRERLLAHVGSSGGSGSGDTPPAARDAYGNAYSMNTDSHTNFNRNPIRDGHILMLRPNLAASRAHFLAGYPITIEELDALSEESAEKAYIDKVEVDALRERLRREGDGALSAVEVARIAKSDAEKARIAVLAQTMAEGWSFYDKPRQFDPFGRMSGYG